MKVIRLVGVSYRALTLTKAIGGKRPLWHAKHPDYRITGAGNTAENAIKDFQKQYRAWQKNK